ncbi:hypothetical protein [Roseibium sediminicola]|uniref:Uncharacterized protein n=1 Tax=Roseibium sediminicola TaxID=2933272 RepID=A0ABT0GVN3_9HYPH|nr:hypothetical protein [Roseibium sp. CAU 1639]MCK7612868.1 hypothetical protein [Roseibium sp. CAU 1639]
MSDYSVIRIFYLLLGLFFVAGASTFGAAARTEKAEPGSGPEIKLEIIDGQFLLNAPITVRIFKHRIPPNSSVGIFLVPVMPENNPPIHGVWNPGCDGPLSRKTISLSGTGVQEFEWNGRATWWAPADGPMPCEDILPGRYLFQMYLYQEQDVPLVGMGRRAEPVQSAISLTFDLTGELDLSRIERDLNMRAVDLIQKNLELPNASDFVQAMYRSTGKLQDRNGGYFCQNKVVPLPHEGLVRACTTVPVLTELGLRLPYGEYVETRPIMRISRRAGAFRDVLLKARDAAAIPMLARLEMSVANEVGKGESCSISTTDPECHESFVYVKESSVLRATVENLFYQPERDDWAFLFKFEASKNGESLFEVESFVCVSGQGHVMQVSPIARELKGERRPSKVMNLVGLECEGS